MGYGDNPYVVQDVNNIIDAYTHPGRGKEILRKIKGSIVGTGYGLAEAANTLQAQMDRAQSAIETIYGYGTFAREDAPVADIAGVDFKNTALTIGNDLKEGNIGAAAATLLADCVPCKDRIVALLAFNPLEEVILSLDTILDLQTQFITDLWDLLLGNKAVGVFADICSLLQFLNFMCIPDLTGIILVLEQLLVKYTVDLKDIKVTLADILAKVFGSSLEPLLGMLDRYIQLILAPIRCILDQINVLVKRADISDIHRKRPAIDTKRTMATIASPFRSLQKYLQDGVDYVQLKYDKLQEELEDLLGLEDDTNKKVFDVTLNIQQVSNLIGLVQALILALSHGGFQCNEGESIENFINNYVSPNVCLSVLAKDGQVKVAPCLPPNLPEMHDLLQVVGSRKLATQDMPIAEKTSAVATALSTTQGITLPIKNCLYTIKDDELDRVKSFVSTFE